MNVLSCINDWSFNFLEPYLNISITGSIYNSKQFTDGKYIITSSIDDVYLENNYILVKTHNSKYILGTVSDKFNEYFNIEIKINNLDKLKYNLDNITGVFNCIKWYLSTYS